MTFERILSSFSSEFSKIKEFFGAFKNYLQCKLQLLIAVILPMFQNLFVMS